MRKIASAKHAATQTKAMAGVETGARKLRLATKLLCGVTVAATVGLLGAAAQAAPSSFQRSCTNIHLAGHARVFIIATCKDVRGYWHRTSFELRGIENINGVLMRTNSGASSFQRSCPRYGLRIARYRVSLWGLCRRVDGSMQRTHMSIHNVENINGHLTR